MTKHVCLQRAMLLFARVDVCVYSATFATGTSGDAGLPGRPIAASPSWVAWETLRPREPGGAWGEGRGEEGDRLLPCVGCSTHANFC